MANDSSRRFTLSFGEVLWRFHCGQWQPYIWPGTQWISIILDTERKKFKVVKRGEFPDKKSKNKYGRHPVLGPIEAETNE